MSIKEYLALDVQGSNFPSAGSIDGSGLKILENALAMAHLVRPHRKTAN
jgi:hypothetical protein